MFLEVQRVMYTFIRELFRTTSLMTMPSVPIAFSMAAGTSDVVVRLTTMPVKQLITTIFVSMSFANRDSSSVRPVYRVQYTNLDGCPNIASMFT
jgi:hypothetical protein